MSLLLLLNQPSAGPTPATTYTQQLSGSSGAVGVPVTITWAANGSSTAVITPHVSGVTGTFSPTTRALNGTSNVSATFTPTSAGTAVFTATNGGSLTDPSSNSYTVTSGSGETVTSVPVYYLTRSGGNPWSGEPFSLVNGGAAAIAMQLVIDDSTAIVQITPNGNRGPYILSDGYIDSIELAPLCAATLVIVTVGPGGLG